MNTTTIMHRKDFLKTGVNKNGHKYSAWTKEGVRNWIRYVLHHPEAMAEVHLHLVDQNIKLSALMFSTPAGPAKEDNCDMGTCDGLPCHDLCYAIRAESFRPSAFLADMENALMLRFAFDRAVEEFKFKADRYCRRCYAKGKDPMVRWHQAGEFTPEDSAFLDRVKEIYKEIMKFYGYTKREKYYVKYYNDPVVNILWSGWRGMEIPEGVLKCGPLKAFFIEFKDGKNDYIYKHLTDADKKRIRRCPGLIKGEFACNKCKFQCAKSLIMIAHEH